MDLLAWHGQRLMLPFCNAKSQFAHTTLGLFAANLNRHFADQVLEFVLEAPFVAFTCHHGQNQTGGMGETAWESCFTVQAVIADTDETVLSKAATGRTHTRPYSKSAS